MSKQSPPAPTVSAVGLCPTIIQTVGRPGTGREVDPAPSHHPTTHELFESQPDEQPWASQKIEKVQAPDAT